MTQPGHDPGRQGRGHQGNSHKGPGRPEIVRLVPGVVVLVILAVSAVPVQSNLPAINNLPQEGGGMCYRGAYRGGSKKRNKIREIES